MAHAATLARVCRPASAHLRCVLGLSIRPFRAAPGPPTLAGPGCRGSLAREQQLQRHQRQSARWLQRRTLAAAGAAGGSAAKQVSVRHILLEDGQEELLRTLKDRIQGGEDMAALAAEYSKCPSGRGAGGGLGWLGRGQTVPEFDQAAFSGSPLGVLLTCKTRFGLHLLTVEDEREAAQVVPMSVEELAESLAARSAGANEEVQYVDVREEREHQLAALPHFQLLPLSTFQDWEPQLGQLLNSEAETVCLCHHGVRSMQIAQFLLGKGFTNVRNVTGGIDAFSRVVDGSVPQY